MLDTNAIVALLRGEITVVQLVNQYDEISISVISKLEFLAFERLSESDKTIFGKFCGRVKIYDLRSNDNDLFELIIKIRKKNKIKLPDAIIAATAMLNNATLLTGDKSFFEIENLKFHAI